MQPQRLVPEKNYGRHLALYVFGWLFTLSGAVGAVVAVFARLVNLPFPDWTPAINAIGVGGGAMLVIGVILLIRYGYVME